VSRTATAVAVSGQVATPSALERSGSTFALNVCDAYNEAPGSSATVRVFTPVTNQTYTMSCAPSGSGITCAGANNGWVTFRWTQVVIARGAAPRAAWCSRLGSRR
jgi:hypothetical protein